MNILMVNDMGYKHGGAEIYMFTLKEHLERKGHEVAVFSSISGNNLSAFNCNSYEQSRIPLISEIFNLSAYREMKKTIKKFRPDVVHLHNILYHTSPSILANLKNIPTVMTVHDYTITCPRVIRLDQDEKICVEPFGAICLEKRCVSKKLYYYEKIKRNVHKKLFRNVDLFIAPSHFMAKVLTINKFKPVRELHYSIDISLYNFIEKTKIDNIILFIGRIVKEKGINYLLEAMPLLTKRIQSIKLLIAGDGNEKNNLIKLSKKLNICQHVEFFGMVPNEKTLYLYQKADVIVIPSIWPEVLGIVGLEAMASGKPTIGSNVGGIPEWLEHEKIGFLVEPRSPDQIAEKIMQILLNGELIRKMGKNARKRVEKKFNIKDHVEEVEKIYQKFNKSI